MYGFRGSKLQMVQPDEQATRAINQQRAVATESETVEKGLTQLNGALQSW